MAITQAEIDRLARLAVAPQKLLIDGKRMEGEGGEAAVDHHGGGFGRGCGPRCRFGP